MEEESLVVDKMMPARLGKSTVASAAVELLWILQAAGQTPAKAADEEQHCERALKIPGVQAVEGLE